MRETQLPTATASARRRITPAYAGNTSLSCFLKILIRDHPRVCGKHSSLYPYGAKPPGSPPRMRETLPVPTLLMAASRITPAYAGNTARLTPSLLANWDHPRVCGKHLTETNLPCFSAGSPPRMRETLYILY